MLLITWLLVATATAISDMLYAIYYRSVTEHRALRAGLSSVAIHLGSAFVVQRYIADCNILSAVAVGAFIGTTVTIKVGQRKVGH